MSSSRTGRRRWPWVVAGLVVVSAVAVGAIVAVYPVVASTSCPWCYGMTKVHPRLYVDDGSSRADRRRVVAAVAAANARVTAFYGTRESAPRVLACTTVGCYEHIGGGRERGVAVLNRAVILSPRGLDPVIASHEMSHVELHRRLGSGDDVPQWFDEGLAVLVSGDPRYLRPASAADRCRVEPGRDLPVTLDEWLHAAGNDADVYARSACRVSRWVDANGGPRAVLDLVDRLQSGERFADVVPD
ncbi:MAG: hypothetical protein GEV10_17675 [Streptosporangiales bacterium]|nr:hypothetical protein [Streptosporangiales bacterium]